MNYFKKLLNKFTYILIFLLGVVLIYSTGEYIILIFRLILTRSEVFDIDKSILNKEELFLSHVHGLIAGVLLIIILIELIQTLIASMDKSKKNNYLLIFFEIGTIAVIRHLFIFELDQVNGVNIIGIALLTLVLGVFNLLFRPEILQRIIPIKQEKDRTLD